MGQNHFFYLNINLSQKKIFRNFFSTGGTLMSLLRFENRTWKMLQGSPLWKKLRQRGPPMVLKSEISTAKGAPFSVNFFQRGYPFEISKNEDFGKTFFCNLEILRFLLEFFTFSVVKMFINMDTSWIISQFTISWSNSLLKLKIKTKIDFYNNFQNLKLKKTCINSKIGIFINSIWNVTI